MIGVWAAFRFSFIPSIVHENAISGNIDGSAK